MLYHAILQLNQKATQKAIINTRSPRTKKNKLLTLPNKQSKKGPSQLTFNTQNTINRRNDIKKLISTQNINYK